METLLPKLRFPEFMGNWKRLKIKEITNVTAGGTPSTVKNEYWNGSIRWMNSGDLNFKRVFEVKNRITELGLKKSSTKFIPKYSILIGLAGQGKTRGTVAMNMVELCINQSIAAIYPKNEYFISDFLYHDLDNRYEELRSLSTGDGGRGGLNLSIIKDLSINLPSLQEQTKIANFLSSIDEKINLLKEKKVLLEEYKKGIMQKIFNQEIRFKDDNGNDFEDWETSILSDVVNLFHGYQFRTSDFTSKGIAVIKISNVIGNNLDLNNLTFIKKERFKDFISFEINNDDILMSLTGNIGRIIEVKDKPFSLLQNYRVGKFIPLDENVINKPFLKYLLASDLVFGRFTQLSNQSAQANFGKQDMDKINISYPTIDEQNKISTFLSAIDEKIELVSNQIQDTQDYKKGLLQQMFV
jgi:type I restriction enzyme S subunit